MEQKQNDPSKQSTLSPSAGAAGSARVKLTPEALDKMMPAGEYVHTFMQAAGAGLMILGADWKRSEILKAAANGAELSGEAARRMKHGAVVWNEDKQPVFVATIEAPNGRTEMPIPAEKGN